MPFLASLRGSYGISRAPRSQIESPIRIAIIGDKCVDSVQMGLESARTALRIFQTFTYTKYEILPTYSGSDLTVENFDIAIVFTNSVLRFHVDFGPALNNFAAEGGNLILGGFFWGTGMIIPNFNYTLYSPYVYNGDTKDIDTNTYQKTMVHPITYPLSTTLGFGNTLTVSNIALWPSSTSIASWPNGTSFLATRLTTSGGKSIRHVGINHYLIYVGMSPSIMGDILARSVLWVAGII